MMKTMGSMRLLPLALAVALTACGGTATPPAADTAAATPQATTAEDAGALPAGWTRVDGGALPTLAG
ncbi:MAG TPA: hemin ABC transporter substrate-binding protein, partial [Stenotrophomonas sp.]|nr:hemin ABC transporter substrate-binding protein [Stenotrophomonas sp.]